MSVILLIVVLVALIVVHELGHFFAAKLSGMRVDEFGVGYPPRAAAKRFGETEYSLNWLPFGGFVKIYGEDDPQGTETSAENAGRAFSDKNRALQAFVLIAGVAMNLVFAWLLISGSLLVGTPRSLDADEAALAPDAAVTIAMVGADTPADEGGLMVGDTVTQVIGGERVFASKDAEAFTAFVAATPAGQPLTFDLMRNGEQTMVSAVPRTGVVASDPERAALGVQIAVVGTVPMSFLEAPVEGAKYTWEITKQTAVGLAFFFGSIFNLSADLTQVAGPVGIATAVGDAAHVGVSSLVTLAAVISINLALINLLPVPALDGGRLLFVIIEAITRRKIPTKVASAANALGFAFLILLMVAVTISDIGKLI